MIRRAKIVCTLGPASSSPERIGQLIDEGMDVARLNFSHGGHEMHAETFRRVRAEAEKRGKQVGILQDLQGPKIRVGRFENGSAQLEVGADFILSTDGDFLGTSERASTTYESLPTDVKTGDLILLDDGMLQLEVDRVEGREVYTRVMVGGKLSDNKGLNLPGVKVSAPALTDKDKIDLAFGLTLGVDFMALSFVRSPEDLAEARVLAVTSDGRRIPLIAKIERPEAVERLDEIVDAADGIMVARGDLGVEMGPEKVPLIQKRCIDITNARGKLVIVATQMLETMISNPRPTRAEASDVANAVLDGTDALMLSGETASGRYPLLAVRTMSTIICEIENSARFRQLTVQAPPLDLQVSTAATAHAAMVAARQMRASVIAVVSDSGGAARLLSEYRPEALIVAYTSRPDVQRQLAAYWGVSPERAPEADTTDGMILAVAQALKEKNYAQSGDVVVITLAVPLGSGGNTNLMKIHRVA